MGFSDANIVSKIALIVLPFGVILIIIGLVTPYWYTKFDQDTGKEYWSYGLWKYCYASDDLCRDVVLVTDWWGAARAFVILGVLSSVAGMGLFVLSIVKNDMKFLKIVAVFPPCVAGIFVAIGVSVYAGHIKEFFALFEEEDFKPTWSLFLTIAGGGVSIIAGVIWIVGIVIDRKG